MKQFIGWIGALGLGLFIGGAGYSAIEFAYGEIAGATAVAVLAVLGLGIARLSLAALDRWFPVEWSDDYEFDFDHDDCLACHLASQVEQDQERIRKIARGEK